MAAPKQGIQLKQSQSLAVTPQMQQSLKVLQCNRLELEIEIAAMLDGNIMLERVCDDDFLQDDKGLSNDDYEANNLEEASYEDIPETIDSDIEWEQLYDDKEDFDRGTSHEDIDGFQQDWVSDTISFDEQLENSIHLSSLSDDEKRIAANVLAHLDEHYFLSITVDKLAKKIGITTDVLKDIIDVIKHLDPPGVASQNIQECMLAQLHSLSHFNDSIGNAHDILTDYFSHIGQKNTLIIRRLGLTESSFDAAIDLIRTLSPYPRQDSDTQGTQIRPDVFIHQKMGVYYASLNQDARHDIAINTEYARLVKKCTGDEKNFMSAQLQSAKFFLKALDQRYKTVLRVSNAIVMQQQDYFIKGDRAIQPLLMRNIAETLNLAESTISRAVNGKYMSFNHRLIELRYFFSGDLSSGDITDEDNDTASSTTAVKALIKELIDNESPRKPLSDSKIESTLHARGINIARRTVAKYRESLGILPTSKRKRRI